MDRCRKLGIHFSIDKLFRLDRLLAEVPVLEGLYLTGYTDSTLKGQTISIVQPQPRLHTLLIDSDALDIKVISMFNPGWTNLTHVALTHQFHSSPNDRRMFLTFLQNCPNLEQFFFDPVLIYKRDDPVVLTHPNLRVLGIMDLDGEGTPLDTFTLSNLRHLYVAGTYDTINTVLLRIPSLDESKHRIFNLIVQRSIISRDARALFKIFNPGWKELTHIKLDDQFAEAAIPLAFQYCPHLENIAITMYSVAEHLDYPLITHPMLRSLSIRIKTGPIGTLLDVFTFPSLRHLGLEHRGVYSRFSGFPVAKFKDFLVRSNCPLETLKIKGQSISIEDREGITSSIPTLRSFELYDLSESRSGTMVYSWTH